MDRWRVSKAVSEWLGTTMGIAEAMRVSILDGSKEPKSLSIKDLIDKIEDIPHYDDGCAMDCYA